MVATVLSSLRMLPSSVAVMGEAGASPWAERRIARQAARANHDRTMEAFLDAAQRGDLQGPTTGPKLTTMRMEPVAVAVVEPQKDCPEGE